jgi:hypothetical protein
MWCRVLVGAFGLGLLASPSALAADKQPDASGAGEWKFDYHGYLRAPMRVGFGKRLPEDTNGYLVVDENGEPETLTLHEATVPDDQSLSFQSTSHNLRSWAEGAFSFGNRIATGTLVLGSYNFTEGGFNDVDANWGITQAFVLLTPDLGYENLRLWAKAGAIVDRYGMSGRYDSGEYDTYMFGRTHVIGETAHVEYDLTPAWSLVFEQGFGTHKPDPNWYNGARYTLLHHEHLSLRKSRQLEVGLHYLMSWSQEEYRPQVSAGDSQSGGKGVDGAPRNGLPAGHLWVGGADVRAELGPFGYVYGAFSHVGADYALSVSRAIEVMHASGGGEFSLGVVGNYLDSPNCINAPPVEPAPTLPANTPENWTVLDPDGCSDGNGSLNALHAHYEFSLTNFRQQIGGGQRFWGDGFDAILKLYGMLVFVDSAARDTTQGPTTGGNAALKAATDLPERYRIRKAKYGADLTVQALPWLSPGVRFDQVVPNSSIAEQNFAILSPRLQFKSQWVTHERLTLAYSRYFYQQRVCQPRVQYTGKTGGTIPDPDDPIGAYRCAQPPSSPVPYDGFGSTSAKQDPSQRATGVTRPDENVVKIEATMWW